jgi:hypothetical protein
MYTGFYSVCPVLISGKNGLAESSRFMKYPGKNFCYEA